MRELPTKGSVDTIAAFERDMVLDGGLCMQHKMLVGQCTRR